MQTDLSNKNAGDRPQVAPTFPPDRVESGVKASGINKRWKTGHKLLLAAVLLIFLFSAGVIKLMESKGTSLPDKPVKPWNDNSKEEKQAQLKELLTSDEPYALKLENEVRKQLLAKFYYPAETKFNPEPVFSEAKILDVDSGYVEMTGKAIAKNGFGAQAEYQYLAHFMYRDHVLTHVRYQVRELK